jgi:HEAT repeat protein
MNSQVREYYRGCFQLQFLEARGMAFQNLFNSIMSKLHPGDFMPCRPWGAIGDRKNDGYLKSERILFQVHAPNEISSRTTLLKMLAKIESDFTEALPYWERYMDAWVFVHNSRDGAPPDVIEKLLALGCDHAPLKVEAWGYEELWQRVQRLTPESLQALLGPIPAGFDQTGETVSRHLRRMVESFTNRPLALMSLPNQTAGTAASIELSVQAGEQASPERFIRHHDLREAMKREARLIVVGPGGAGKSTALRRACLDLASALAADPGVAAGTAPAGGVPVFVSLKNYKGSLPEALATVLHTDAQAADALLREGRLVLFLDDFDGLGPKGQLLEELEELGRLVPPIRYMLATRPDPALRTIGASIGVRYDILPLSDGALTALFAVHLGADDAEVLFKALEDQHIADAFRLPLMAWFATVEFREFNAAPRTVARGAIFKKAIDRLLLEWSPLRRDGRVDPHSDLKLECLQSLASEMVRRNTDSLASDDAERIFRDVVGRARSSAAADPVKLLDEVTAEPLFEGTRGQVQFRHLSLRDHFAAGWLAQRATPWKIAYLSRGAKWHEAVIHLVGLLDEARTRTLLHRLVKLSRFVAWCCTVNAMRWSADWIFLVLRCLVESPQPIDDLRDRFLEHIRHRVGSPTFWLDYATHPTSSGLKDFGVYAEFDSLLGRLGTRSAFEFVRSRADQGARAAGLGQFRNVEGAAALLAEFDAPEERSPGHMFAAHFLLRFPADLLRAQGERYLRQATPAAGSRFLDALSLGWWSHPPSNRDFSRWTPLLVATVLADDRAAGKSALNFLRPGGLLTNDAERLFLDALSGTDRVKSYRAIWPLVYSRSAEAVEALRRVLHHEEVIFGLRALDALRIQDDKHFADHAITLLRSHASAEVAAFVANHVSSVGESRTSSQRETFEKLLWLWLGLGPGVDEDLRFFCVRALGNLGVDSSHLLVPIFQGEEPSRLRSCALGSLAQILGNDAAPYLVRGLEDPDSDVRDTAGYWCGDLTGPAAATVLPYLRALSSESVTCRVAVQRLSVASNAPDDPP